MSAFWWNISVKFSAIKMSKTLNNVKIIWMIKTKKNFSISFPDGSSFHQWKITGPFSWCIGDRHDQPLNDIINSNYLYAVNRLICLYAIHQHKSALNDAYIQKKNFRPMTLKYFDNGTRKLAQIFLQFMAWNGVWWPANPVIRHDFFFSVWVFLFF